MPNGLTLAELLEKARKRVIAQLVLDKGALALAIGMGVVILLLLTGTQILDWYWPVLIGLVSLGVGVYQLRGKIPSLYSVAQRIDAAVGLKDALSTATFFKSNPRPGSETVCELQRRGAEEEARNVDLKAALPFERSKYLAPALGLLLVAGGLFALRYAVTGSMNLDRSLLAMAVDSFLSPPPEEEAIAPLARLNPQAFEATENGVNPADSDDLSTPIPPENAEESDPLTAPSQEAAAAGNEGGNPESDAQEGEQEGEQGDEQKGDQGKPEDQDKGDKQGEPGEGDQSGDQSQDQKSMLDKLRDALSDMLNKKNSDDGKQQSKNKQDQKQKSDDQKGDKSGEQGDEQAENAEGEPQNDSGQQGDQNQSEEAQNSEQPSNQTSEQASSGSGSNDGEKSAEEAAMLEAMGKLSELMGARAEQIAGEVMIEVGQTKQQLRTQFTAQQSGHSEAGSEIHRDEIPLLYQQYVERYFQEVHKPSANQGKAKQAAPAAAPANGAGVVAAPQIPQR